jgi:hypothetical protein
MMLAMESDQSIYCRGFGTRNKQPTILSVIDYPQLHECHGVSLVLNDLLNSHFLQKKDGSVITLVNPFRMHSVP